MLYRNEYTKEISFPLGGIGSGSIGLAGNGQLVDWEIFNRPAKGSLNGYTHFAVKAKTKSGVITKVLNGDLLKNHSGHITTDTDTAQAPVPCAVFRTFRIGSLRVLSLLQSLPFLTVIFRQPFGCVLSIQ